MLQIGMKLNVSQHSLTPGRWELANEFFSYFFFVVQSTGQRIFIIIRNADVLCKKDIHLGNKFASRSRTIGKLLHFIPSRFGNI